MRKLFALFALVCALNVVLAACGPVPTTKPKTNHVTHVGTCNPAPGAGVMGACVKSTSTRPGAPRVATGSLFPDISEFQGCPRIYSPVVFRVYEAYIGEDHQAGCHEREAKKQPWFGVYAFVRPTPGCTAEADNTVRIVKALGGVTGPIIEDAEVWLPAGFVGCFLNRVHQLGYKTAEYTCPGCGDERVGPIWIADYPYRPAGSWVAHQFSDNYYCRGIQTDCSVDEGIENIRQIDYHTLRILNELLGAYNAETNPHGHNCQNPPYEHAYPDASYDSACATWAREKREVETL